MICIFPSLRNTLCCALVAAAFAASFSFAGPALVYGQAADPAPDKVSVFSKRTPTSVEDLRAMQERFQELSQKVIPSTVGIRIGPAQGSGVIISKDGYVLTAGHVIGEPGRSLLFILSDGRIVRGKSLGLNGSKDSGLAKITEPGEWPALEMGKSSDLKDGDWVLATGHPGGYQVGRKPVVRIGRVLSRDDDLITTDCTLVGGDSGGPLFDMHGRVVAIHSRIGASITANLHIPIDEYHATWDRLAASEAWGFRPYVGVTADSKSEEARVAHVHPGTPADNAGIRPGDVIVRYDGKEVKSFSDLSEMVQVSRPGQRVKVVIRRDAAKGDGASADAQTVELTLVVGRLGE